MMNKCCVLLCPRVLALAAPPCWMALVFNASEVMAKGSASKSEVFTVRLQTAFVLTSVTGHKRVPLQKSIKLWVAFLTLLKRTLADRYHEVVHTMRKLISLDFWIKKISKQPVIFSFRLIPFEVKRDLILLYSLSV